MIVVHHLNNSRSQRILWLLEELEIPYEIKYYQRDPKTMLAPPELKKVHPLGKSPVLVDNDKTLAESGLIIDYLIEKYGQEKFKAEDTWRYRYWLHYAEGSLMPPLLLKLVFAKVKSAPVPFFIKPIVKKIAQKVEGEFINPQLQLHLGYLEGELAKTKWFAGNEMSGADIQMSFPLEAAAARGGLDNKYPRLQSFLERIHARAAYQKALQKGGPYDYA